MLRIVVASLLVSAHAAVDWNDKWGEMEKKQALKKAERRREAQTLYLEARAKEADVVVLPSGLMYKVLEEGDGTAHPKPDTPCDCHYKGNLVDGVNTLGEQFDSSYDRDEPSSFAPNQVIAGWTEAMQLMVEGDKWEMYIPAALGYGDAGDVSGTLVFTMELLKINGATVPSTRPPKAKPEPASEEATTGDKPKRKRYTGPTFAERKAKAERNAAIKKVGVEILCLLLGVVFLFKLSRWNAAPKGGRRRVVKMDAPNVKETKTGGKKKDGRKAKN